MVVLVAWSKVVAFWGLGSGRALIVAKTDCWSTRCTCYRCGVPRYFDGDGMGQGLFAGGPGKGGGMPGLQGQRVGAGTSGVRLVGAFGRDQTYVSTGIPRTREAMVGEAGVGPGGNRVRFQEIPEDTTAAGRVGVEATGAAPKEQGKTQRDLILVAVESLKALSGQGVGTQVVDLIQERIHPTPHITTPGPF